LGPANDGQCRLENALKTEVNCEYYDCNILEKVVVLLQQRVPPIYATCFSKSIAILKKKKKHVLESATLLSSGPSTCVKTFVKRAVQPL